MGKKIHSVAAAQDVFKRAEKVSSIPPRRNIERDDKNPALKHTIKSFLDCFDVGDIKLINTRERTGCFYNHLKNNLDLVYPRIFLVIKRGSKIFIERKEDAFKN